MDETGLPISCGISTNKFLAKIATGQAKPNGFLYVPLGKEKEFLSALPVEEIPGVGKALLAKLKSLNIHTISHLQNAGKERLIEILGNTGKWLWEKSEGKSNSRVNNFHEAKSISAENTFFENLTLQKDQYEQLVRLTEKVCFELRADGKYAGNVAVKIRYPGFETRSMQTVITPSFADDEIIPVVKKLFGQLYRKGEPVRLLGVRLSQLTSDSIQTDLFQNNEKKPDLYKAIDNIKGKFGKTSIRRAGGG